MTKEDTAEQLQQWAQLIDSSSLIFLSVPKALR